MHYVSRGHGAPPLVFVHGFTCDHGDWNLQLEAFQKTHRVVACDLRGHGATPGDAADCTIGNFGADVAALLAELDLASAILVGHSMGCRVVLEAARLDPERVCGIVLVDGSRMGTGDPRQAETAMRTAIQVMGYPDFAEALFSQMFLRPSPQAERIVARAKRMPADTGMAAWLSMVRWDAQHMDDALAAVQVSLTAIQSTWVNAERKRVPLKAGQSTPWLDLVRQRVPGARTEIIPGIGHFTQLEAAASVNRLLGEACRSAGAP